MASLATWKRLKWFKRDSTIDKWGDPGAIDDMLLLKLDAFRSFVKTPVIVTSGVRVGEGKSQHFVQNGATAVDVVLPQYEKSAFDLLIDVGRFDFRGVGFYSDWRYNGEIVGGLHLDTRIADYGARWMGIIDAQGKRRYLDLNIVNLMKYAMDDMGLLNDPWLN